MLKLRYGHADPRDAGVGNIVNCGAAMYIAPVGIANAGDPRRRLRRGDRPDRRAPVELRTGGRGRPCSRASQRRCGPRRRPTRSSRRACGWRRTARALRSRRSAEAAAKLDGWRDGGLVELRRAFAPFDSVGEQYAAPALNARIPSRLHAIEELPIALGLLVATGGDYEETVLGGVNYGRDSDSIASMGGALAGALGGTRVRRDWVEEVSTASKIDVEEAGRTMAAVASEIFAKDAQRHQERAPALADSRPARSLLDAGDLDPARGPRRARAPAGARGTEGRGRCRAALARRGRSARAGTRRLAGARRARAARACARAARRARRPASPARRRRARGLRRDPGRGRSGAAAGRPGLAERGSRAPGSAAPRAACSASRSRTSRARVSARSRRRPATGRSAAGSPPRACRTRSPSGGRGTGRAVRRASPRTSTGSPRTTTSTSRCSASRCSSAAAPASTRSTSRRSGSTTARRADLHGRARRGAQPARGLPAARDGDAAEPVSRVDRREAARRRLRLGRSRRPGRSRADGVGGRARSATPPTASTRRCSWRRRTRPRSPSRRRRRAPTPASRSCRAEPARRGAACARELAGEREWEDGRRRALRALRHLSLGARDQQHGARRGGAVRLRRRLLRRDLGGRPGRLGHGHERRRRRLGGRRRRRRGRHRRALVGAAGRPLRELAARLRRDHARRARPAHRSPSPARPRRRDASRVEQPRDPLVAAADRPADSGAARAGPDLEALDTAKIFAAPDDPGRLARVARRARPLARRRPRRGSATTARLRRPELAWTQRCFAVALAWLWDELLYDHDARPLHARAVPAPRRSASSAASTGSCSGTRIP